MSGVTAPPSGILVDFNNRLLLWRTLFEHNLSLGAANPHQFREKNSNAAQRLLCAISLHHFSLTGQVGHPYKCYTETKWLYGNVLSGSADFLCLFSFSGTAWQFGIGLSLGGGSTWSFEDIHLKWSEHTDTALQHCGAIGCVLLCSITYKTMELKLIFHMNTFMRVMKKD